MAHLFLIDCIQVCDMGLKVGKIQFLSLNLKTFSNLIEIINS